jgi:hypothetical protein
MFPLLALVAIFSMIGFAESWSGKLIDASCYDQQKKAEACDASSATTSFALDASGMVYKLDRSGNTKAATAFKNRAERSAEPNKQQPGPVVAKVSGTEKGGTITVESIELQ